jgi:hypothetical protein
VTLTLAPGQSSRSTSGCSSTPRHRGPTSIAIDTTGSMADAISQAKSDATAIVNDVQAQIGDARFAVVAFKDSSDGAAEYELLQRLLNAELAVSNGPNAPCKDDSAAPLNVPSGLGTISVGANLISSSTVQTPDDLVNTSPAVGDRSEADARASVVTLLAGAATVRATVVSSHAEARCSGPLGGTPTLSGSSVLTNLTVNGSPVVVGSGEVRMNLLLGVLHINSTTTTATGVTQRGIWFENTVLPWSLDVVVAEARAGFTGNPCV